jgi:parallel beta-helix repeat protein
MVPPERSEETVVLLASPPRAVRELQNFTVLTVVTLSTILVLAAPAGASAKTPPTAVPTGTSSAVTARSSTPPPGAVVIGVDDNAKKIVAESPAGSSFILASGTHELFSVIPLPGDAFYGQPGTVLDGEHTELTAFKVPHDGTADDVQIIGAGPSSPLVVENYGKSSHSQVGAIQSNSQTPTPLYSNGWWLQWVEVTGSSSRGISVSDDMVIFQCQVVSNARLGIGGGGNGITIDQSTVSGNGLTVNRLGWEAGGIKTVASNVLIERNVIDGNGAPGIWTDGGATNVVATQNTLQSNRYGIRFEISHDVTATRNIISNSQQQSVLVIASSDVTVRANILKDNFGGIIVGGVGTVNKTGIHLDDVTVSHNTVIDSGATGLHQTPPAGSVIHFDYDRFVGGHLQWDGHGITLPALQALGQERHGGWSK